MRIAPLIAAAVLALVACGGGDDEQAATPRQSAPAITGTTLGGEMLSLEDFRGKPVMVNAWASW
jgi:hypothetical protein